MRQVFDSAVGLSPILLAFSLFFFVFSLSVVLSCVVR